MLYGLKAYIKAYIKAYKIGYLPIISTFFYKLFFVLSYCKSSSYKDLEKYFENSLKFIWWNQISFCIFDLSNKQ